MSTITYGCDVCYNVIVLVNYIFRLIAALHPKDFSFFIWVTVILFYTLNKNWWDWGKADISFILRVSIILLFFTDHTYLWPWLVLFLSLHQKDQNEETLLHKRGPAGSSLMLFCGFSEIKVERSQGIFLFWGKIQLFDLWGNFRGDIKV